MDATRSKDQVAPLPETALPRCRDDLADDSATCCLLMIELIDHQLELVLVSPLPERSLAAIENPTGVLADAACFKRELSLNLRHGVLKRAAEVGERLVVPVLSVVAVSIRDDDLFGVSPNDEVRVVGHHENLSVTLALHQVRHNRVEDRAAVEVVLRLIDQQRPGLF